MSAVNTTLAAILALGLPLPAQAPPVLDPQRVQDQDTMTWADYRPIPGVDWANPAKVPARRMRIALVAVDFPDQPFVITQPKTSDLFGNPQIEPIPRERVPRFYADFWNRPQALNHGQTINGYWMEQSRGRFGIPPMDVFGPYRMPKNLFQYGLNEWGQQGGVPTGFKADGRLEKDVASLWQAEQGEDIAKKYDVVLRVYAGYDETSIWQEFGEMKFQTREDIPEEWGNPDRTQPRWVATRYVPWTSWKAGQMQWGLSSIRQGENSGTITHEIAHFAFRIGDNNNNPYAQPYRRAGSGPWDLLDRGSFNGPGGPHRRWVVPATEGASMPAGLMLRQRLAFQFVSPDKVVRLNRNSLAQSGLVVARVVARAVEPGPGQWAGITVALDGPQRHNDHTPAVDPATDPLSPGIPNYDDYSLEVVQRIGYDSFTPDSGVLLAKNKTEESRNGGPNQFDCFNWVIDAHPEDIHRVDYLKPGDHAPVMRTVADYRQLNDALFHAGLDSGSACEWEDAPNRLHFYVVDRLEDAGGILSYTLGVRSLDGSGPQKRGIDLQAPTAPWLQGAPVRFQLRNTGRVVPSKPGLHPQDVSALVDGDIYRLSVKVEGAGWRARLQNALAAVRFGAVQDIPVFLEAGKDASPTAAVTLEARSESDPTQVVKRVWNLER